MIRRAIVSGLVAIVGLAGCGGSSDAFDANGEGTGGAAGDSGSAGSAGAAGNAGAGGADASVDALADGGAGAAGSGGAQADGAPADSADDGAGGADDGATSEVGPACLSAGECTGFPSTFIDDATSVTNCAGATHQVDCCGKRRVFGINHGVRDAFCTAEDACRAAYPASPGCSDATITTDSGDTTTNLADVRVRCVGSGATCTCETFVCTTQSCMANSAPIGGCGP